MYSILTELTTNGMQRVEDVAVRARPALAWRLADYW